MRLTRNISALSLRGATLLSATLFASTACGGAGTPGGDARTPTEPPAPTVVYRMLVMGGWDQGGEAGALLPKPVAVRVIDSVTSAPIPSVVVRCEPPAGSGVVSADSAITDAAGDASVRWTLGAAAGGTQHVKVSLRKAPQITWTFDANVASGRVRAVALASGADHACALLATKKVVCWGANGAGQLGDGTTAIRYFAVPVVNLPDIEQLVVGGSHSCGLTASGETWCWGQNLYASVGDGTDVPRPTPVKVATGLVFTQIVAGGEFTCGLTAPGDVYCWGDLYPNIVTQPQDVSKGTRFRSLSRAGLQLCGIGLDGVSRCTDSTVTASGVNGGPSDAWRTVNAPLPGLSGFVGFWNNACALDAGGAAYCWGMDNEWGQYGLGNTSPVTGPQPVSGGLTFQKLYDGQDYFCGVTAAGKTYCWGHNTYSQLGAAAGESVVAPRLMDFGTLSFTSLAAGASHFCGLATDTTVYCWGASTLGALGDGSDVGPNSGRVTPGPVLLR
jgi:alpha-tubulin suppressor-like RCC1 family protein